MKLGHIKISSHPDLMDDIVRAYIATTGGLIGGGVATMGLGELSERSGRQLGHTSPQRVRELLDRVKRERSMDVGYMHDPYLMGSNAGYITKKHWAEGAKEMKEALKEFSDEIPAATRKAMLNRIAKGSENVKKHGLIITGKHYKKPGTMEHELGHAIAAHRGNAIEQATIHKDVPGWSPLYHWLPSMAAGIYFGGKSPMKGLLAGGLTGLVTDAPTLYSEYSANKYADDLIEPGTPTQSRGYAYGTYLANSVLPSAITGALYGLMKK